MNITISWVGLIGQFLIMLVTLFAFFNKFMNRISKIESRIDASDKANEVLRNDFTAHVIYVKEEFGKIGGTDEKILVKLEAIKDSMHKIELDVVEMKAELKFKNSIKP